MRLANTVKQRVTCGLLLSTVLVACETTKPVDVDDRSPQASLLQVVACMDVELDAVYSGPPARANQFIDLNDLYVYVEVHDVLRFAVPNQMPSANDVRLGDDFATGTPAESYALLDINNDGKLDIRIRFSKFALVADGNLDQQTTEVQVWGLDRGPNDEYCGSLPVEVFLPAPEPGEDVVVFNDINIFDAGAMSMSTDNATMVRNLVTFNAPGPRNNGTVVMWDRGRNAPCGPTGNNECNNSNMGTTRSLIMAEGFTISDISSSSGTLTSIPANVKSIWLWTPRVQFTTAEINTLKQFASEGGRIVFIGEWAGYYTQTGIDVENAFLQMMGAQMTNTGGAVDCGYTYLPGSSIRSHQVTTGVDDLTIACASVIVPGAQDFILYYNTGQSLVLAGVAKIDTTPLSTTATFAARARVKVKIPTGLNVKSSTGR